MKTFSFLLALLASEKLPPGSVFIEFSFAYILRGEATAVAEAKQGAQNKANHRCRSGRAILAGPWKLQHAEGIPPNQECWTDEQGRYVCQQNPGTPDTMNVSAKFRCR